MWRESAVRKPCCACNTAYPTACLRTSSGSKGQMKVHNVAFLWMNDWMTNSTHNCASYFVGSDNGMISLVGAAAGRSRLQTGMLVIFFYKSVSGADTFRRTVSIRAGDNRKQREHPPEVWSVPPVTPCIYIYIYIYIHIYIYTLLSSIPNGS
jgi:hypothetical protein